MRKTIDCQSLTLAIEATAPHVPGPYVYDEEATAKLFAAAPDLLKALENARNVLAAIATGDLATIERDSPALAQARAAIEKAKGV